MNKGKTALLLVLTLIVGLLSSACNLNSASTKPEPRYHYGSTLDFIDNEEIEMVKLSEMEYVRPDNEEVKQIISELESLIAECYRYKSAEEFLKDYYPIMTRMRKINAMYHLTYFRRDLDQTDSYYQKEFEYCLEVYSSISQKEWELMSYLADTSYSEDLETLLFGKGFFDQYTSTLNYTDNAWSYYDQIQALGNDFLFLTKEQKTTYNGETKTLNEWLESDSEDVTLNAVCAYIEQYHDNAAAIYINILKASRNFAKEIGYKNYADYIYDISYNKDYTAEEIESFNKYIKTYLVPIAKQIYQKSPGILADIKFERYPFPKDTDPTKFLSSACRKMGGLIEEVCNFTTTYELYDYSFTPTKRAIGYNLYIPYYETSVILINPSKYDVVNTLSHEFGHSVDNYYNYGNLSDSLDEMYSQAMEYLTIKYTDVFSEDNKKESIDFELSSLLLGNILDAAALAAFENAAYKLDPDEVTPEMLDELYLQIYNDYGLEYIYPEEIQAKCWIYRHHLFNFPFYTIKYPTSAIASLEICALEEEEQGKGVATYEESIKLTSGRTFKEFFDESSLDNPLEEETIKNIAEFLKKILELE
jgi:oligoendopeptidase F